MQLGLRLRGRRSRSHRRVATSLFAATASLLGSSPGLSIAQEVKQGWRFDASASYYGETSRVTDASGNVLAQRGFRRGLLLIRLAFDALTGASASGAAASRSPQTFTNPSGKGTYTISPGSTPLDPTFHDSRKALAVNWQMKAGARGDTDFGVSTSDEFDYSHRGINGRYSIGLDERNTTLAFGAAFASDTINPVGGAPVALAPMLPPGVGGNKRGDDSKTVVDALVGVTQVLGPRTIAQFNYSYSRSTGYLTDPYKLLTVIDPATGDPVPGPGTPFLYLYENRPDTRTKHSVFGQLKHQFDRPVLDASYRYMTDDWGVDSHTLDLRWRQPAGARWYLQPHLRYYRQSAAGFYQPYLLDATKLPEHASADYRLGEMDAYTLGMKVGRSLEEDREWSVRIEYYRQSGRAPPGASFGSLSGLELAPPLDAVITQFEYRF